MRLGARGWSIGFEFRHVLRSLRRSPVFTAVVIGVLAIGIAGATVVYSVAGAILFRPIPYTDPGTLALVMEDFSLGETVEVVPLVSHWQMFEWLRDRHSPSIHAVAASSTREANLVGEGWSERCLLKSVTPTFLSVVGVRPSVGRGFADTDFQAGNHRVAILSHALWRSRFGADRGVVGRTVLVNSSVYTIIGVLPATFGTIDELQTGTPAAWLDARLGLLVPIVDNPWRVDSRTTTGVDPRMRAIVRLADARSLNAARSEVEALGRRVDWPGGADVRISYTLRSVIGALNQDVQARVVLLGAAAGVLVLLSCATAALLMLERRESRKRELAIRAALGATRAQLIAEAGVEAVSLGMAAGVVALWCAWLGIAVVRSVGGAGVAGLGSVELGWRAGLFALSLSAGTALVASVGASLTLLRSGAVPWVPLGGVAGDVRGRSAPSRIVVAQIGLSVGLVITAGMLARDFARLASVDLGFLPKGVLTARVAVSRQRHPDGGRQFFEGLLQRLPDVQGVEDVAIAWPPPGIRHFMSCGIEGARGHLCVRRIVSRSYFSLLGIPMLAGRTFTEAEVQGAEQVAVVNSTLAEKYWGSAGSALGEQIRVGQHRDDDASGMLLTIVGVARDAADDYWPIKPQVYLTYSRAAGYYSSGPMQMSFVLRLAGPRLPGLERRLKRVVDEADPYSPLYGVRPVEDLVGAHLVPTRLLLTVVGAFSALATLLAAAGVYVVLAFAVTRRTREFGVRVALGASRRQVLQLVLGHTLGLVGKGVLLTLPVTFSAIWLTAAQFFGVTDTNPRTCLWAILVILATALLASAAPVWRAVRVDPSIALRQE